MELRLLLLPPAASPQRRAALTAEWWRAFQRAYPRMRVVLKMADPPLPDDVGEGQFLDGTTARYLRAKAGGAVKRLRRDLLTSVAAVAQLAETWRPDALIGIGQGALVALAWAHARAFLTLNISAVGSVNRIKL